MNSSLAKNLGLLAALLAFFLLSACGGGDSSSSSVTVSTGSVTVLLTDATSEDYQAVYVTITEVQTHRSDGNGWETVSTPNRTYNLLALVNGVREQLGLAELQIGNYTQIRLIIGNNPDNKLNILGEKHPYANYLIDESDLYHELKVPSGQNTGLKLVNGFDVEEGKITEVLLDFDANRSVVKAGKSGKWLLKPVIRILYQHGYTIATGFLKDADTDEGLQGAKVSAQTYNETAGDEKDQVIVEAATRSDSTGEYALFLEPDNYNLVATKYGYDAACTPITTIADQVTTQDLTISQTASTGSVEGTVSITGGSDDDHVRISFRQVVSCGTGNATVIVKTISVANGGTYNTTLPAGDYRVVAAAVDKTTQASDQTVPAAGVLLLDFSF